MKRRLWLLSITLLMLNLLFWADAHSSMTGADFMQAPPSYQNGFINGFVRGMYAACIDHLEAKKDVCSFAPVLDAAFDMTPKQVLDAFLKYIRKNGERQQKEASELLVEYLREMAKAAAQPEGSGKR
jgi:hypothetical protein